MRRKSKSLVRPTALAQLLPLLKTRAPPTQRGGRTQLSCRGKDWRFHCIGTFAPLSASRQLIPRETRHVSPSAPTFHPPSKILPLTPSTVKEPRREREAGVCAPVHTLPPQTPHASTYPQQLPKPHRKRTLPSLVYLPAAPFRCLPRRPLYSTLLTRFTQIPPGGTTNMSSLSRRACFKCGNVGHYAGELPFLRGCLEGHCRKCCRKTAPFAVPVSRGHALCNTATGTQY
ncbi:hypothetical protein P171DRAFT_143173 [Karstenula rhodostoma CBS 690.94]|uniref:Uncharacterized protein n=1 Tax=Karstenula rhodostoma CBS 690.94 TaxID=1392251 RepID=A0A9P4PUF3_9PLEO|nr:hypothetical protein P171DRAFT_143173 [Karstenula rhodostoma CBS 690.94]